MTHDPKLVEALARTLWAHDLSEPWDNCDHFDHGDYLQCAKECLDAIAASGIAWVAPREPTETMIEDGVIELVSGPKWGENNEEHLIRIYRAMEAAK